MPAENWVTSREQGMQPKSQDAVSISPLSVGDQVHQRLSEWIVTGQLKPGDRLRIQELAKTLGVSDTPVREAMMRLQHNGLVEIIPRAESRVRVFTKRDIEEIYDLRQALECFALKQAVKRMPDAELHRLLQLLAEAGEAMDKGDIAPSVAADVELHAQIVLSADNARISSLMANIRDQIQVFRRLGARTADAPRRFLGIHQGIVEELLRRDATEAVKLMEEHMQLAKGQAIVDYLGSTEGSPHDSLG